MKAVRGVFAIVEDRGSLGVHFLLWGCRWKARTQSVVLGLVILANLLTGCMTVACDPDDPQFGKDCYECTRKATRAVRQVDPDTGSRISTKDRIKDQTEECLRERGYMKQKQEGRP